MSIASEITRIKRNIASAYSACESKGGTLPQTQNSANLAAVIMTLSGAVKDTQTYNQVNGKVAEYLANVTYDPSDYSVSRVSEYASALTDYRKDRPVGVTVALPSAATVFVYDGKGSHSRDESGNVTLNNLTPAGTAVFIAQNANDEIVSTGLLKPTGALRMIDGGSDTYNIRDLGGWSCDSGTLRYGKIFRGCELNGENGITLTDAQKKLFTDFLNIQDEIDLRGNTEVDGNDGIYGTDDDITDSALGSSVDYVRYPINPYGANNAIQNQRYTGALTRIIDDIKKDHTCYVHCVAGADRTGTICALIEGLCGVAQSDIDKDYELTSFSGEGRLRNNAYYSGFISSIVSMPGTTFRDKVVAYVLQLGVYIEEINALRNALIDGTPDDVTSPFAPVAVTNTLSNVSTSNNAATTRLYEPYTATLTPAENYSISLVTVTMGGTDISASVYKDGEIKIPRVTGAVTITATAVSGYTNLVPTSTVSGGGAIYNGTGYKDGAYVSGVSDGVDAAYTATGYITYAVPATGLPPTIYVKGASWKSTSHTRMSFYNSSYEFIAAVNTTGSGGSGGRFDITSLGTDYFKIEPVADGNTSKIHTAANDVGFVRFSFEGTGENLVVAFEPIS